MSELASEGMWSASPLVAAASRPWLLIVDSNFDRIELLEQAAGPRYRIAATHRGTAALAALERYRPAVLIAGDELSDMSGEEFLRRSASRLERAQIPVLRSRQLSGHREQDLSLLLGSERTTVEPALHLAAVPDEEVDGAETTPYTCPTPVVPPRTATTVVDGRRLRHLAGRHAGVLTLLLVVTWMVAAVAGR